MGGESLSTGMTIAGPILALVGIAALPSVVLAMRTFFRIARPLQPRTTPADDRTHAVLMQELTRAEGAREALRRRVSFTVFQIGWASLIPSLALFAINSTSLFASVEYSIRYSIQFAAAWPLMNLGLSFMLLAVQPATDANAIKALCVFSFALTILAFCWEVYVTLFQLLGVIRGDYAVMESALVFNSVALVVALCGAVMLWPATRNVAFGVPIHSVPTPRAKLLRLWLVLRVAFILFGMTILITGPIQHNTTMSNPPWMRQLFTTTAVTGASLCLVIAAASTPSNRGRIQRVIGSLGTTSTTGETQEAAAVAGLLGQRSAAAALSYALTAFRAIKVSALTGDDLSGAAISRDRGARHWLRNGDAELGGHPGDVGDEPRGHPPHGDEPRGHPLHGDEPRGHPPHGGTSIRLFDRSEHVKLGECDAFISHSWHDDGSFKYAALCEWAETIGAGANVWLDKACIDQSDIINNMIALPIYLSGCKQLVVLAGATFSRRLWCAVELYTFLRMGGSVDRVKVVVLPGEADVVASLAAFDARTAQCYFRSDRDRLLSIIELGFGTLPPFNKVIRGLLSTRVSRINTTSTTEMTSPPRVPTHPTAQGHQGHHTVTTTHVQHTGTAHAQHVLEPTVA